MGPAQEVIRRLAAAALFISSAAAAPVLSYATYLSGASANAIAVDAHGNAYVGGNGYIAKLDPAGGRILQTFTVENVLVNALALDAAGNLAVAGSSGAAGYAAKFDPTGKLLFSAPLAAPALAIAVDSGGAVYVTGEGAYLVKLSAGGSPVYLSSLLASAQNTGRAIAVDAQGDAYLAGDTLSTSLPITANAAQSKFGGGASAPGYGAFGDAFLAKLSPTGALLFATYWGGSSSDVAYAVALDAAGNAYIAGGTSSADFPVTPSAFQTRYAGPAADPTAPDPAGDAFLAKFSPTGAALWSTYWGGASADVAYALALDAAGNVHFAGTTESFADFPRAGAGIPTCRQTGGPFAAELDPTGSKLQNSTGMSGLGYDNAYAIAVDSSGAVYLAGDTESRVFFATPGAAQTAYSAAPSDAFAARIDFTQPTGVYSACVLNAASFAAGNFTSFPLGTVAPGEIVSIFGSGLGRGAPAVSFDGFPAPLLYAGDNQINAIVPYEVNAPVTQMTVQFNGQSYGPIALPVAAAVPAIFPGAILNQDGTLNSISNPAPRGSIVTFYAEGAGAMSPPQADGAIAAAPNLPAPALSIAVAMRGVTAAVQYAGAAPGYASGLLQVNAVVPASIDFGNLIPLTFNAGNFSSQPGVTLAVK